MLARCNSTCSRIVTLSSCSRGPSAPPARSPHSYGDFGNGYISTATAAERSQGVRSGSDDLVFSAGLGVLVSAQRGSDFLGISLYAHQGVELRAVLRPGVDVAPDLRWVRALFVAPVVLPS